MALHMNANSASAPHVQCMMEQTPWACNKECCKQAGYLLQNDFQLCPLTPFCQLHDGMAERDACALESLNASLLGRPTPHAAFCLSQDDTGRRTCCAWL